MVWINIYTPHTGLPATERKLFVDQHSICLGDWKPNELPVVGGDINAWLGVGDSRADSVVAWVLSYKWYLPITKNHWKAWA